MLELKKILIGVTGSIAAYKTAALIRLLVKEGAEVKVVMTPLAKEFITPLTLSTLSNNPVYCDFFERPTGQWNSHVSLSLWADLFVIAPATANTIGKMANGIADNLLLTTYLSARCPVMLAPAMDRDMFLHPANQKNIETLRNFGNILIEPSEGELASGLQGKGRMEEPEKILAEIIQFFKHLKKKRLTGKKVLVTAGPTYENIDPVRYIGNRSSGKMGYAIAETLADEGAEVTLISGPVNLTIQHPNISVIHVKTAQQMYDACIGLFNENFDAAILAAAVSDFTPETFSKIKLKRKNSQMLLTLKSTKDIAAELGKMKRENQVLVGFALETDNAIENAMEKMKRKNFDFIVLNSLLDKGAGFEHDTNKITIIDTKKNILEFDLKTKKEAAADIIEKLVDTIQKTAKTNRKK